MPTSPFLLVLALALGSSSFSPSSAITSENRVRVAFSSERHGREDVYVMFGEGSFPKRVTPCSGLDRPEGWVKATGPTFSPDGRQLAYHVYREGTHRILCVSDVDGRNRRVLVGDRDASDAAFSPDGKVVVFRSEGNLWIVPAKGGEPEQVTDSPFDDRSPSFSPDGKRIVFSSGRYVQRERLEDIFVVELDSRETTQLTDMGGEASLPTYSPDGAWIAFNVGDEDCADIWLMRPDGSDPRAVTKSGKLYGPAWSPDSRHLYATGFFGGNTDVYVLDVGGKTLRRLSDHVGLDHAVSASPKWSTPLATPDPSRVELALDVESLNARNSIDVLREGNALVRQRRWAEAAGKFGEVLERDPDFGRVWYRYGLALHQAGERERALGAYRRAATFPKEARSAHYNMACLFAGDGRVDEAFTELGRAIEAGFANWGLMERDPDLAGLRDDPRFAGLRKAE